MAKVTISNDNRYHRNRVEIAEYAKRWDCDIASAARRWANDNGVTYGDELREFENYVCALQSQTNIGHNLVKKYFAGEDVEL